MIRFFCSQPFAHRLTSVVVVLCCGYVSHLQLEDAERKYQSDKKAVRLQLARSHHITSHHTA